MKHAIALLAAVGLPLGAQAQDTAAGEAAARKLGCFKCHAVASDKDGPSFRKSAEKYKGQAERLQAYLGAGKDKHPVVKGNADPGNIAAYILSR